jgi:hypothetical protein
VRSLEELQLRVRDGESRARLDEAVRAYNAGALRAALISTWVTVALDLVSKIRELADTGDVAAAAYVSDLDKAITDRNLARLQRLESGLLKAAQEQFQMFTVREGQELQRLCDDRNVCAHPAFVAPDQVFNPSPELVRAHIATAVDAVLAHPPLPGKQVLDRLRQELLSDSLPSDRQQAGEYLRARYLNRARTSVARGVGLVLVKSAAFPGPDDPAELARRAGQALASLEFVVPELVRDSISEVLGKRDELQYLTDADLLRLVATMGDISAVWSALSPQTHGRCVALLSGSPAPVLVATGVFGRVPSDPGLQKEWLLRLENLLDTSLATALTVPLRAHVPTVARRLEAVRSWRGAEQLLDDLVLPLAGVVQAPDIDVLLAAVASNGQCWQANGTEYRLGQLYERSKDRADALTSWQQGVEVIRQLAGAASEDWRFHSLAHTVTAASASA